MTRLLPTLREHITTEAELTADEASAIARDRSLKVGVTPKGPGLYDLRPESIIGSYTVGDVRLLIRPRKLTMDRVLWMLSYALDPVRSRDTVFEYEASDTIEDVVGLAYGRLVERALARGVLQGYRTVDEALPTIRGRLRVEDQLRKRLLIFPPAEVTYDDYTENITENRLLRAASRALLAHPLRSPSLRGTLRRHYGALAGAADVSYHRAAVPNPPITRLNARYAGALHLGRLILETVSYDLDHGGHRSTSFLVDMNDVFQRFVHTALEEALGCDLSREHPGQLATSTTSGDEVARGGLPRKYDTALVGPTGAVQVVIDAKYKLHKAASAARDDVHQMLAYCIAEQLHDGVLVYVKAGQPEVVHSIKHVGVRIHVLTVDLDRDIETTLADIRRIAKLIKAFSSSAAAVYV
jgi:5-methylcytosine-specific restriction enzyme subunit McrC